MDEIKALLIVASWSLFRPDLFTQWQWFVYSGYHIAYAVEIILTYYI